IPVSEWSQYDSEFLSQLSILREQHDNGNAEYTKDSCVVNTLQILNLSDIDKQILGLPEAYPYVIYVQSKGQLNQDTFQFNYGFFDFAPNGTQFIAQRKGPILKIKNVDYLLSGNEYDVCEAIDAFNQLPQKDRTFSSNLKRFSKIKALSNNTATELDSYLINQEVHFPSKIIL